MKVADFFPDIAVLNKYRGLGWHFDVDSWTKDGEDKFALSFQSPRMKKPEITYLDKLWGQTLKEEEAWAVARRFMDENLMFQATFKQAMLDLFNKNTKVDPDAVEIDLEFKTKTIK